MRAASHAKIAKSAKNCYGDNAFWTLVLAGPLGDLGALCVMHAASHAKIAKSAKNCNEKNNGF
jgi:hypothetical protein